MSREQLTSLRADFNPSGVGILWDLRDRWFATTPAAEVIEAASADELRRALRTLDGTTAADTRTLPTADQRQSGRGEQSAFLVGMAVDDSRASREHSKPSDRAWTTTQRPGFRN